VANLLLGLDREHNLPAATSTGGIGCDIPTAFQTRRRSPQTSPIVWARPLENTSPVQVAGTIALKVIGAMPGPPSNARMSPGLPRIRGAVA
jgi:hypothetical protein